MSKPNACVERGAWAPIPTNFVFSPATSGAMTFHMVGCSGDPGDPGDPDAPRPGSAVAGGMAAQITDPGAGPAVTPSFLYHLGDIAYTESGSDMTAALWNTQFYAQYKGYAAGQVPVPVFAIAGNHDGNTRTPVDTSEIYHFVQNLCGPAGMVSPDNTADPARTELAQPYMYWRLDTPLAYIIGLYGNVSNGGVLDDPTVYNSSGQPNTFPQENGPQFLWLVDQLTYCQKQNATGTPRAILLAVHYPPYNGATDFQQRGDPTLGGGTDAGEGGTDAGGGGTDAGGGGTDAGYLNVLPLGMMLQSAYTAAGQIPDAVFSAHAHLYQRLTLNYNDPNGKPIRQVPHLVAGGGGHAPLELMDAPCAGKTSGSVPKPAFNLFTQETTPPNLTAPQNATVMVDSWLDGTDKDNQPYGFLRVTLTPGSASGPHPTLLCEFFTVTCDHKGKPVAPGTPTLSDSVTLDLVTHLMT